MIDNLIENQLIRNNTEIQRLLKENEELLRTSGFDPPVCNYVLENDKRIHFPNRYIRKSSEFWEKYHLNTIVKERNVANNISYCLQLSDFYNFILNRFFLWGSVGIMLYKQDFINLVSVIEALILEVACNISEKCKSCRDITVCQNRLLKRERQNMKSAIEKMYELEIVNISREKVDRIIQLYDLRNRVHIRLANNNEFLDDKFNIKLHNETISLLIELAEDLYRVATQHYTECDAGVVREQ